MIDVINTKPLTASKALASRRACAGLMRVRDIVIREKRIRELVGSVLSPTVSKVWRERRD